ncbi:cyclase family protein [Thermocatellispora tengchongensis]|uniref:cyclase family protein n=1 Tax=Thermocatellispora tengchongensis TaxID=1073253 RepID=UPI0036435F01
MRHPRRRPLHSGRLIEGKPARTISDISLDELFRPGMVLDVRRWVKPGAAIPIEGLQAAIEATGREIQDGDAVLIRTGQERYTMADAEYYNYPGMTGDGTRFLTSLGASILGTDALAWDRPFPVMRRAFEETGDPAQIWDGHFAIRDKEAFIVQQLTNLAALPPTGFTVGFFPLKLPRTSAAPARVVAFLGD